MRAEHQVEERGTAVPERRDEDSAHVDDPPAAGIGRDKLSSAARGDRRAASRNRFARRARTFSLAEPRAKVRGPASRPEPGVSRLEKKITKIARRVRGALRRPEIDRIFMGAGGSGSSFVVHALRGFGVRVAERPDVMLRPAELANLDGTASLPVRTMFTRRANGFVMDGTRSIEANVLDFLRRLESRPGHTALFSNLPSFRFFSRHRIRNVVFLVRDPVQAYASFAKPVRHQDLVDEWGGAYTKPSMRRYVEFWRTFVDEYFALRDAGLEPGLLRYEMLLDDAQELGLARFFPDWKRSRNRVEDGEATAFIRGLAERDFLRLYPGWDV
jgi:hypothetical protein